MFSFSGFLTRDIKHCAGQGEGSIFITAGNRAYTRGADRTAAFIMEKGHLARPGQDKATSHRF